MRIPLSDGSVDTVTTTYAFHHVPDEEKRDAIKEMLRVLRPGGKIVIADVMFKSEAAKRCIGEEDGLAEEIEDEYFATVEGLGRICAGLGLECQFERLNRYVWIVEMVSSR